MTWQSWKFVKCITSKPKNPWKDCLKCEAGTWYPGRVRTASTTARAARCCRKGILWPSLEPRSTCTFTVNMAQPRGLSQAFLPRPMARNTNTDWASWQITGKITLTEIFMNTPLYTLEVCMNIVCMLACVLEKYWPLPWLCRAATATKLTSFGKCSVSLRERRENRSHKRRRLAENVC